MLWNIDGFIFNISLTNGGTVLLSKCQPNRLFFILLTLGGSQESSIKRLALLQSFIMSRLANLHNYEFAANMIPHRK